VHLFVGKAGEILGEDHGARLREGGDEADSGAARSVGRNAACGNSVLGDAGERAARERACAGLG
jgi:hypothetical protein